MKKQTLEELEMLQPGKRVWLSEYKGFGTITKRWVKDKMYAMIDGIVFDKGELVSFSLPEKDFAVVEETLEHMKEELGGSLVMDDGKQEGIVVESGYGVDGRGKPRWRCRSILKKYYRQYKEAEGKGMVYLDFWTNGKNEKA